MQSREGRSLRMQLAGSGKETALLSLGLQVDLRRLQSIASDRGAVCFSLQL